MINKNRFRVSNDKKVLHKIGKRWVIVSALTLALLGGGALAGSVTTHAASNQPQAAQATKQPSATPKGIMKTASALHANMLNNAQKPASSASAKSSSASQSASSGLSKASSSSDTMNALTLGTPEQQKRGWNFVQHGINHSDYDKTAAKPKFNSAYEQYLKDNPQLAHAYSDNTDVQYEYDDTNINSLNHNLASDPPYTPGNFSDYKGDTEGNVEIKPKNNENESDDVWPNSLSPVNNNGNHNALKSITVDDSVRAPIISQDSPVFYYNPNRSGDGDPTFGRTMNNWGNNTRLQSIRLGNFVYVTNDPEHQIPGMSDNLQSNNNIAYLFSDDSALQYISFGKSFDTTEAAKLSAYGKTGETGLFSGDNALNTINITSPNTVFNSSADLPTTKWYQKISDTNYTSATPVDLMDGQSHVGTWVRTPNVKDTDTVAFYTKHGNDNVLVSKATVSGADGSSVSISKDVPNDYRLANGDTNVTLTANPSNGDIQLVSKDNQPISSNSYILREVNPYFDDAIIQYQNGSQNVGTAITLPKQTFGKSVSVGSLDNVPAGYQLANPAQQIKYDGNNYTVPVKKLPEAAPYGVVYLNQNKTEVGQATLSNLGYVGQTVNVEPQLAANVPQGYHLDNTDPINVTLNDGGLINVNGLGSTGLGSSYHGLLGGMLRDSPNATDNHVISVSGNPVTYSGNVTLNFKADGQTVKTITKPYSVTTYTGDTVNLLKPSSYLNDSNLKDNSNNPITINATDFTPDGSNNPETVTVQPSDAPQTSGNTKSDDSYSLNYDANSVNDNVTCDLSGANVPAGYHGKTGSKGQTSLNGVYDTNVPLSALKTDAPTNYHIVSGSNIRYDGGSHTIEIAPNTESVSVTYTDQNGHTYTSPVSGQYDQKYSDITKEDHLPAGYHVNAGQDSSFQFNSDQGQSKGLSITGDTQSGDVTVTVKKYDGSNYIGSETKTVHESGETGNGFTIDPSGNDSSGKSLVPAGYQANISSYKGTFTPTGLSTNAVTFDYKAATGTPIKVNYFNQHGANVGSGTITGNTDDTGSISSKVPVPDDYTVDANQPSTYHILSGRQSPIDINVTGKPASATINFINQDNGSAGSEPVTGEAGDTVSPSSYPKGYEAPATPAKYTFTRSGQNPDEDNVRLVGDVAGGINGSSAKNAPKDAAHGYVTVHVVEKSTSGKVLHRFDVPVSENTKRVGDGYTVKPSDVTPSDYDVASGDNPMSGVIDNDGSVSNGSVTDAYTVHANDIEPISITIKNQNGHYIDLSDGKLTDSSDKATSTIRDATLAQLGGVGDKVDITGCIKVPAGYHINGNQEGLTDANGQPLNAIPLEHKQSGLGAMPLMLAIWTPAPKKRPAQPSKPASASAKPSSSAAAQPSSAAVAPSSKAPRASSSASAVPSSANVAPSSAPYSTSSAAPQPVVPSDNVAPANRARIVPSDRAAKPAPHAKRNDSGIASGETRRNAAKSQNQPNLSKHNRRANRNEEKNVSAAPSDSTAAPVSAADGTGYAAANVRPVSAAPVAALHSNGKLPQTGDDAAAGLAGVLMLLSSIGLAGADLDRKHRLN